jgi:multidrug efflux pump subunit AcrA (membrane-fusion protein)
VSLLATKKDVDAMITRRAPSADPGTRTIHFEIDIPDPDRAIPVDTTGQVSVPAGPSVPATRVPISAASINDVKVTLFTVEAGRAHSVTYTELGEQGAFVYFDPKLLKPNVPVVTEGRALLKDGDRVATESGEREVSDAALPSTRSP